MDNNENLYLKVYDFTNENVACLKDLYHLENSRVLSIVGSGDQYFSSMLNGAKEVELFDINPTSKLYFLLKFYAIRELTYEEFFDFLIRKKIDNIDIYNKLEKVLPIDILKYYKYLVISKKRKKLKKECFRRDSITLLSKSNKKYYFNPSKQIIPYLIKDNYYQLQEILKKIDIPKIYDSDITNIREKTKKNYDILLLSNIYDFLGIGIDKFTDLIESFDVPEVEACYDWTGLHLTSFKNKGYIIDMVRPSSPYEFGEHYNFVYSIKK